MYFIFLITLSSVFPPHYNIRGGGCNLVQSTYNNQYFQILFTYKITHLWNKLPTYIKQSPNLHILNSHPI